MSRRKSRVRKKLLGKQRHQATSKLQIEALDPRIVLDASGGMSEVFAAPALEVSNAVDAGFVDTDSIAESTEQATVSSLRHEIVFVDAGVTGQDELLAGLQASRPGVLREIVMINGDSNGLEQIADALDGRTDIDAIHIVSHGDEGEVRLGNAVITSENLNEYETALAGWATALSDDADILFYGCELAGNEDGEQFIESISELTGADVAASDDLTGAAAKGGDWILEEAVGIIEASALSVSYTHLTLPTNREV